MAPEPFSGMTFENTNSTGGLGELTSGRIQLNQWQKTGFKPYGALGFGPYDDKSVDLDKATDKDRVMLVTVTFDTSVMGSSSSDQEENFAAEIKLEVGAYPFDDSVDLTTP